MKPRHARRLTSQPSLSPESKTVRTKRTRLTGSKSPLKFRTSVLTTSEVPITPNISRNPASTEEVQQPQKDSDTDPSLRVNTCVTEPITSTTGSESLALHTSVAVDSTPSSALEIFYGPDGLPLPLGLIEIEEIVEDP